MIWRAIKNGKILLFMKIFSKVIYRSWYIKRFLLIKQALVWRIRLICASKAFFWMCFLFQTLAILFLLYYFHSIIQKMKHVFKSLEVLSFSAFNLQLFMKLFPKMFCLHSEKQHWGYIFLSATIFWGVFYLSMDSIEILNVTKVLPW